MILPCVLCGEETNGRIAPCTDDPIVRQLQWPACTNCIDWRLRKLEQWVSGYLQKWYGSRY